MINKTCLAFWAKLGKATWLDVYHPVLCHLMDVGQVVSLLWDKVLRQKIRRWITSQLGLADESAAGSWLAFWSAAHDIGKVTPCFQDQGQKTELLVERLKRDGFNFPGDTRPHGELSTRVLTQELVSSDGGWPAIPKAVAQKVAVTVGGHHGIFPTNWDQIFSPLGNDRWAFARREMLAELARLFGVTGRPVPSPTDPDDQSVWMYVAGLTSVADWIGSNQEFFPPVGNPTIADGPFNVADYFHLAGCQAKIALENLGWLGRAKATNPVTFRDLYPFIKEPRPLQTALAEIVTDMTEPGLLIVEAPMGEGKTEAGWYTAACWDRRGGQGTYVALPTMATSNQMFDRVSKFLEADEGKQNLMLLHGKAALNELFEELKYAAQNYDEGKEPSAVVAESWFAANKKHGLLAPYGVGTIDQALLAVLQTKHVFVRLFGLAGKCVILDEVHAYDAYMTTLMERLLRWLAALGCPVVLLSATLPRERRLQLMRAYAGHDLPEPDAVPYPRVTSVAVGGAASVRHVDADPGRARTARLGWLDEDGLAETLLQALANGGCAVVIRNTVGLAQKTYLRLREAWKEEGIKVDLFHARFPFGRRKQIEEDVLRWYGRTEDDVIAEGRIVSAPHRPGKSVLVATQVVEQSLDLDFDVMVSDLAPVDLVLQRAGRLHRHERGPRPEGVKEPRLWVIQPAEKDGLPDFGPSQKVYAPFLLLRSYLGLKAAEVVRLPADLEHFVEEVYGAQALNIPDGWQAVLDEYQKKLIEKQDTQQLNALDVAINDPDQSPLEQHSLQLQEDNPEAAKKIQALTRDSDPAIQLIVIYHVEGRDYLDPGGLESFDEAKAPDVKRVCRLLDNEVSINHRGCFAFYAGRSVPKGWRENGLLQHHRILRVDGEGKSLPGDYFLIVDHNVGIRFMEN